MKRKELEKHLKAAGVEAEVFRAKEGGEILVTKHGGRVLGAFTREGENVFFVDPVMFDAATARAHLKGEHILGGDRVWMAPERGLFFKGTRLAHGVVTQRTIDPGKWREIGREKQGVTWRNDFSADFFYVPGSKLKGRVDRSVRVVGSPVEMLANVSFVGYEVRSRFDLLASPKKGQCFGLWFLIQFLVPAGGYIYAPTCGKATVTDYYEKTGKDYLRVADDHVRFKADSIDRHKIGIRKTEVMGRIGFLSNALKTGAATLIVRNFLNDPSANYADVPFGVPMDKGPQDSVQAYNHYSGPTGFSEMEFHSPGISAAAGGATVSDVNQVWIFQGKREKLTAIASKLLYLPRSAFAV